MTTANAHRSPHRRHILRGLAAAGLLGSVWPGEAHARFMPFSSGASRREAIRLGRAYLEEHPGERDAARLQCDLPAGCTPGSPGFNCDSFAMQRAADFEAGDTVLVDGWLLARCEARLLALTALT